MRAHYTGWTSDGTMFASTAALASPPEFILGRVLPGTTEGLQLMVVGEKRRFWIPESLAFGGEAGHPRGTLVCDVELLGITRLPRPDPVPTERTPPRAAACTASGLCSRVLAAGRGAVRPGAQSRVRIRFSSWDAAGRPSDSTSGDEPAVLVVESMMPGLREGLQLMAVGEKRRLWIPASLASDGRAQGGTGLVIYDIELVAIDAP